MRTCSGTAAAPCVNFGPRQDFLASTPGTATSTVSVSNSLGTVFGEATLSGTAAAPVLRSAVTSFPGTRNNVLTGALQRYTYTGSVATTRVFGGTLTYSMFFPPGYVPPTGAAPSTGAVAVRLEVFTTPGLTVDLPSDPLMHSSWLGNPSLSIPGATVLASDFLNIETATADGRATLSASVLLRPGDTFWVSASLVTPAGAGVIIDASNTFVTGFDDFANLVPGLVATRVPEPGTLALILVGLTGIAGLRRTRRR
jgi:hypothetical protein